MIKEKKFFTLEKDDGNFRGGMNVDMPATFTPEAAEAFLDIWNYFIDGRSEDLTVNVKPLAKEKHGNNFLRCRLRKERGDGLTTIVSIPPPDKKKYSRIEALVSNGNPMMLEMVLLQLKGGQVIRLIRKPQ